MVFCKGKSLFLEQKPRVVRILSLRKKKFFYRIYGCLPRLGPLLSVESVDGKEWQVLSFIFLVVIKLDWRKVLATTVKEQFVYNKRFGGGGPLRD